MLEALRPRHSFRELVALPGWRLPHTSLPHMLYLEPTIRNLPLSGVKGSLIT